MESGLSLSCTENETHASTPNVDTMLTIAPRPHLQSNADGTEAADPHSYVTAGCMVDVSVKKDELVIARKNRSDIPKKIFPFSCLDYTDLRPEACKFKNRGCLCKTWGLKDPATREQYKSMTWYKSNDPAIFPIPVDKHKNGVELADTKLILCSNTGCKKVNEESVIVPTAFHYCCYASMIYKEEIDDLIYAS